MTRISRKTFLESGGKGGKTTMAKYGREYFVNLGKKSAEKRKQRSATKEKNSTNK